MKKLIIPFIAIISLAACSSGASPSLEEAADECNLRSKDKGQTITLDVEGDTDLSGDSYDDYSCLVEVLDVPSRVEDHIGGTRALDGTQSDGWDSPFGEVEARWTYHPDDGLFLTVWLVK